MNLITRVVSGVILIAVVAGGLWIGGWLVALLVLAAAMAAVWEFNRIAGKVNAAPFWWLIYPLAAWWAMRTYLPASVPAVEAGLVAGVCFGLLGVVVCHGPMARWAASLAGSAYIGLGLGYFAELFRWSGPGSHFGLRLVVVALIGPIVGDTAAYFAGSAFGKHRFFPAISPKKSVEGAVASALATIVVLAFVACWLLSIPRWQGALLGVVVTIAAQGGDLAESKFKREAGIKDSSALIPGHGGLLDRLDSLLLVAPAVYWFAWVTGLP